MRQRAFTIVTEVEADQVDALEALLDEIGDDIEGNSHLRLSKLPDLHYASLYVVREASPYLVVEGNVDGTVAPFLRQMIVKAGPALDLIYSRCAGYPSAGSADTGAVFDYLTANDIGTNTFYVGWRGRSVSEIRREEHLRQRIGELLDAERDTLGQRSPEEVRRRIQDFVRADPSLAWALSAPPRPWAVRNGRRLVTGLAAPAALGAAATVAAALAPGVSRRARRASRFGLASVGLSVAAVAATLRDHEVADERRDRERPSDWQTTYANWSARLPDIAQREDVQVQNHLASVTAVKRGWFRLNLLRVVLWVIDVAARLVANKGNLGGIGTIHFARWCITRDGGSLLFMSNFDGSWESYLNDFIDLASPGLTAVWTNSDNHVGFPRTRWLVREGARDEQRFKAYARYSQARTRAWYSAYPDLTVANIGNNMVIREQLFAPLDADATRAWLRRL